MRIIWSIILGLVLIGALGPARAEIYPEASLSLALAGIYSDSPAYDGGLGVGRIRLETGLQINDLLRVEGHYQVTGFWGESIRTFTGSTDRITDLRVADLPPRIGSDGNIVLDHNLDRLFFQYETDNLGIVLGRQVIGHGSGFLFNPTDIFGPLPIFTTYSEYKIGVDGLRISFPRPNGNEYELIAVFNREGLEDGLYLVRAGLVFDQVSISLYGGTSYSKFTAGLDLSGEVLGATWYAEGFFRSEQIPGQTFRAAWGASRRIAPGLDLTLEAYFNNNGASDPGEAERIRTGPGFRRGELFLTGRWYLAMELGYEFHPLVRGSLSLIQSLVDGSTNLSINYTVDLTDSVSLAAGARIGFGEPTRLGPSGPVPGDEFGDYGETFFIEVKTTF